MFSLEMISKEDETGIFPWTDDDRLALGAAVEISMGYGDDREPLIVGEITALEPTFSIARCTDARRARLRQAAPPERGAANTHLHGQDGLGNCRGGVLAA